MAGKPPNSIKVNEKKKKKNKSGETNDAAGSKSSSSELFASCSFSSLGLHPTLCEQLKERLGFETPTSVQAEAIPVILSGKHVLVNAATGTGKTLAYLAPVIHHLQQRDPRVQRSDGTFVRTHHFLGLEIDDYMFFLLFLPVYEILQKILHRFHWIVPGYIMGGENRSKEKARLRKGITILVATPGRLLDHLKHTSSFLHVNLRWVIFDEADRILELGFGKDIEEILDTLGSRQQSEEQASSRSCKGQRQNLLLSATLNEKVNKLANISLENPIMIGLGRKKIQVKPCHQYLGAVESNMDDGLRKSSNKLSSLDEEYKLPAQLVQRYVKVPGGCRLVVLLSILKHLFERDSSQKVVVFFATRDTVDFHYSLVNKFKRLLNAESEAESQPVFLNCKTFRLHGEMEHVDRRSSFQAFNTEKSALLLSTDVAARGLDFPKVRCIIQYDPPGEATEYVHRVGRTARLGERGDSLLFLQPVEIDYVQDLEKHGISLTEYPLLKILDSFPLRDTKHSIKKFVDVHPWVVSLQRALEAFISTEPKMKVLAMTAFSSWVRAYTAHRGELKRIFVVQKLHLGHVAKSFGLKDQPSLVNKSLLKQSKKRKRDQKQKGSSKKRMLVKKS